MSNSEEVMEEHISETPNCSMSLFEKPNEQVSPIFPDYKDCILRSNGQATLSSFFTSGHCRPLQFFENFKEESSADWLDAIPLPLVYAQVLNKHLGLRASKTVVPSDADKVLVVLEMRCRHTGKDCPTWATFGSGLDLRTALDAAAVRWIRTLYYMTRERHNNTLPSLTSESIVSSVQISQKENGDLPSASISLSNVQSSNLSPHSPEFYPSSYIRTSESDSTLIHKSNTKREAHLNFETETNTFSSTKTIFKKKSEISLNTETPEDHLSRKLLSNNKTEKQDILPAPKLVFLPENSSQFTSYPNDEVPALERLENIRVNSEVGIESHSQEEFETWRPNHQVNLINQEERTFSTRYWSNKRRRRRNQQDSTRGQVSNFSYTQAVQAQASCYETYWLPQPYQYPVYQIPYFVYPAGNFQNAESTVQIEQ